MSISPAESREIAATAVQQGVGLAQRDLREMDAHRFVGRRGMRQADHGAGTQVQRVHNFQTDGPVEMRLDAHAHAAKDAVLDADAA